MKKYITSLLLLSCMTIFSQELKLEKGKFYKDGVQISSRDTRELLKTNVEASSLFRKAKSKESNGGFVFGLGVAVTVADLVKGLVSDEKYPGVASYIGVGMIAVSIPILSGRTKKFQKAVEVYNTRLKSTGALETDFQVNIISNQNGQGIQLRF